MSLRLPVLAGLVLAVLCACRSTPAGPPLVPGSDSRHGVACPAPGPGALTVAFSADIAERGRTAKGKAAGVLISAHSPAVDAIILYGDNVRYNGPASGMSLEAFYQRYWAPAGEADWARLEPLAYPQVGNHEYAESEARGYFTYFAKRLAAIKQLPSYHGEAATVGKGWYSFDLGAWHVVSLNSNCTKIPGGCDAGSPQETWLATDLAAHAAMPTVAVWHAPRYSCGGHTDAPNTQPMWADLAKGGVDFLVTGHSHFYERWKPLDAAGAASATGLTQFIAGSMGVEPYDTCGFADLREVAEAGGEAGAGVLFMTLAPDGGYCWEYRLTSDGSVFESKAGRSSHARSTPAVAPPAAQ
jgi:hypothetical protein